MILSITPSPCHLVALPLCHPIARPDLTGAKAMDESRIAELTRGPPIYVVTGGTGAS